MNISSTDGALVFGATGYVIVGLVIGVANLWIGMSIAKYSALRQLNQYLLLMVLAFADAANMFCFVCAGLYRLLVLSSPEVPIKLSPAQCASMPHVLIWSVALPSATCMLVVISIDRLVLVLFPKFYLLSLPSPKYALYLCGTTLAFTSTMAVLGIVGMFSEPDLPSQSPFCYNPPISEPTHIFSKIFGVYYSNCSSMALASVIIFSVTVPIRKFCSKNSPTQAQQEVEAQKRMTRTIALSCLCTLCLYSIPDRLAYYFYYSGSNGYISPCLWVVTMTNPLANCFLYQRRHAEIRVATRAFLVCKQLPMNLNLWPKSGAKSTAETKSRAAQTGAKERKIQPSRNTKQHANDPVVLEEIE